MTIKWEQEGVHNSQTQHLQITRQLMNIQLPLNVSFDWMQSCMYCDLPRILYHWATLYSPWAVADSLGYSGVPPSDIKFSDPILSARSLTSSSPQTKQYSWVTVKSHLTHYNLQKLLTGRISSSQSCLLIHCRNWASKRISPYSLLQSHQLKVNQCLHGYHGGRWLEWDNVNASLK